MIPGVMYMDHGERVDPIIPGELDRGGAINLISPYNVTSIRKYFIRRLVTVRQMNLRRHCLITRIPGYPARLS